MSQGTKIEWTDATWNPVTGCTRISPACQHCYAERMSKRLAGRCGYPADEPFRVTLHPEKLEEPLHWKKPRMIFTVSMGDLFHDDVPFDYIDRVFAVMAMCPQHTFQVLTKRADRLQRYFTPIGGTTRRDWIHSAMAHMLNVHRLKGPNWPLPNVWLGVTAENQEQVDKRIPLLLQTPAAVRFVSIEPMLGPIDLYNGDIDPRVGHLAKATYIGDWWEPSDNLHGPSRHGLDWVIAGGETGPGARPMHPDWVRSLREQCNAADVPFFFKSWGDWLPNDQEYGCYQPDANYDRPHVDIWNNDSHVFMARVGKKAAGALLDGREWRQMPERSAAS